MLIDLSDEQLAKEKSPIILTEEGIVTSDNEVHPLNDSSPIDTTEDGIVMLVNDVQCEKDF